MIGGVGQPNYGPAKAGVIALTVIAANSLSRYGVNVNAISPRARTRMTESMGSFNVEVDPDGFDPYGPENVSPLVAFLASSAAAQCVGSGLHRPRSPDLGAARAVRRTRLRRRRTVGLRRRVGAARAVLRGPHVDPARLHLPARPAAERGPPAPRRGASPPGTLATMDIEPFRHRRAGGHARRPARPARTHPVPGADPGRRLGLRHRARVPPRAHRLLAQHLRLAQDRGRASTSSTTSRTEIDGERIHFVHARSAEAGVFPIVMTHGWPGSFVEFEAILPLLTDPAAHGGDPADAFARRLPVDPRLRVLRPDRDRVAGTHAASARRWTELMAGLGYDRYGAQGGDWGAMISPTDRLGRSRATAPGSTST